MSKNKFIKLCGVDNVYRTKNYIITQTLSKTSLFDEHTNLISYDVFYERNSFRDNIYNKMFSKRENINGKRISCSLTTRSYADKK